MTAPTTETKHTPDNVGKNVFEQSRWALGLTFIGLIKKETAHFWNVEKKDFYTGRTITRRAQKSAGDIVLPASIDPELAVAAYSEAFRSYGDRIKALEAEVVTLKREQRSAATAAVVALAEGRQS